MTARLIARALLVGLAMILAACVGSPSATTSPEPSTSGASSAAPSLPVAAPSAGAFPADLVEGLRTEVDVPFTQLVSCGAGECAVPLDILAPTDGAELPTIVVLPGGPPPFEHRRYMEQFAAELARRGAVVFLAVYRSPASGHPEGLRLPDVRCAVRYARSHTAEYGGDPRRVILVGHSVGSDLALQTAVDPEGDTPDCLAEGDGIPESVVGLSGFQGVVLDGAADEGPPMLLAWGTADEVYGEGGQELTDALIAAGFDAEYREFEGVDHPGIVDPEVTPGAVDLVFEAVTLAGQR
jgi:acetyl esterase/lipase